MNPSRPRLVVHGAGRMGRLVADLAEESGLSLAGQVSRHRPAELGSSPWYPGLDALPRTPDLLIDFTLPAGLAAAARWCAKHGVALVSGTTGLERAEMETLDAAAERIPVLHAPNFSPGVNALMAWLYQVERMIPTLRSVTITDVHHAGKKDAPSGTALALAKALEPHRADIESRREGAVVGDHAVRLELPGERLTLEHHAIDRSIFARGALQAGLWLLGRAPGRYDALDWIGGERGF